jgi:hypothetical protein
MLAADSVREVFHIQKSAVGFSAQSSQYRGSPKSTVAVQYADIPDGQESKETFECNLLSRAKLYGGFLAVAVLLSVGFDHVASGQGRPYWPVD